MPTKNPRINVMVEDPVYRAVHAIAAQEGVSMSSLAQDLIREALEIREDVALTLMADERDATRSRTAALTHEAAWE